MDVSVFDGKLVLEIEDNFYYGHKFIDSIDDIKETMRKMLEKFNNQ